MPKAFGSKAFGSKAFGSKGLRRVEDSGAGLGRVVQGTAEASKLNNTWRVPSTVGYRDRSGGLEGV